MKVRKVLSVLTAFAVLCCGHLGLAPEPNSVYAEEALPKASYWKFDEGGGSTAVNSVEGAPDAAIKGAEYIEDGASGTALRFNGKSELNVEGDLGISDGKDFVISAYFRTTSDKPMRIASSGNWGWTNGFLFGVGFGSRPGSVSFAIGGGGIQGNCVFAYTLNSFNDGEWHLATVSVDDSEKEMQIFVDGVLQDVSLVGGTAGTVRYGNTVQFENVRCSINPSAEFKIGLFGLDAEGFIGDLDEISIGFEALSHTESDTDTVTVDFGNKRGTPLVKKFGFFESALVPLDRTERDFGLAEDLLSESFRLELGMGKSDCELDDVVTGTADNLQYNFEEIDKMAKVISEYMLPYWAYTYTPYPLQPNRGAPDAFKDQPSDLEAWKDVLTTMAKHFKDEGIRIAYQEIGNEPDCFDVFYKGTWDDYLELYKYGATGLREGDPDAVVGGPSTAWVMDPGDRYTRFLKYVHDNDLPLDFFSMHTYGADYMNRLRFVRDALVGEGVNFMTTGIHINEFNTENDWVAGGPCDQYSAASKMFSAFSDLIEENDVEVVSWAQFLESGWDALGVVDMDGYKKASYNAFQIWSRMPVDRCSLTANVVSGMASTDEHRSSAVIWNPSRDKELTVDFSNIVPENCTLDIYRIDSENCSYGDGSGEDLVPVETIRMTGQAYSWTGTIPAEGVLYFEFNDNSGISELDEVTLGDSSIIRQYHYYFTRGQSNYAYFDERTWTARLGMGSLDFTDSTVGVLAENLPNTLVCTFDIQGNPQYKDWNSLLGIRFDFETDQGYEKSVLFHGGIYDKNRDSIPKWASGAQPTDVVEVDLENFVIDLEKYAPENWNGRTIITYEMQNAGAGSACKIQLREKEEVAVNEEKLVEAIDTAEEKQEEKYLPESWDALEAVLDKARNLLGRENVQQSEVDAMTQAVLDAVAGLKYKPADYTAVDEAISRARALHKDEYKNFYLVEDAMKAVVRGKNITQQDEVDAMAKAIQDAIGALEKKNTGSSPLPEEENDGKIPATGENPDFALWMVLLFVSGVGVTGFAIYNKKVKTGNK